MTATEYYHTFEAILYGIALSHIFIGVGRLIANRKDIKFYWAFNLFIAIGTIAIMRQFYSGMNSVTFELVSSPLSFILIVALNPCSYVLLAYLVIPENVTDLDFKEFYQSRRKAIFTVLVIQQGSQVVENIVDGHLTGQYWDWQSFGAFISSGFFIVFILILTLFIVVDIVLIFSKSLRIFEYYMCLLSLFIAFILIFE